MTDYKEKFEKFFSENYTKGQRNSKLLDVVIEAKKCDIEKDELKSRIKSCHDNSEWYAVEKDFENCWNKKTRDIISTEEYIKNNENLNKRELILNQNFENFLNSTKKVTRQEFDIADTSLLKYFFKKTDWIYIVANQFDECLEATDAYTIIDKETPLKRFQFMSFNTYKNGDGKRNQENLKEMRYILLECDHLSLDKQTQFFFSLIEYGVPVKSIIYSGGKSLHCLIKIHPMENLKEYKAYCEEVYSSLNKLAFSMNDNIKLVDTANKDGIRYTRVPFGFRPDKEKIQKMIYCDLIEADEENYNFEDTLTIIHKFTSLFLAKEDSEEDIKNNFIGTKCNLEYAIDKEAANIETLFLNNTNVFIKTKDHDLQKISRQDLFDRVSPFIKQKIGNIILSNKDSKHLFFEMKDFFIPLKDIKFEVTLKNCSDYIYNKYKPGFITECLDYKEKNITKIPSEFDKLLNNLAGEKEKDWLINHMACHFNLIINNFKRNGQDYILETVPILYGNSGTGKNTLLDIIGQAISEKGSVYISIEALAADFNDFYMAGSLCINELPNRKTARRELKEALKLFTDKYKVLNEKFQAKITILNTAYKSMAGNTSPYGILDIDQFDRRYQYICGGNDLNGKEYNVCDINLLNEQKHDFIRFLLNYKCDFNKAETVFDNQAKIEDKMESLSTPEKIAFWVYENIEYFNYDYFSARTIIYWYNEMNGTHAEVDPRWLGKCLSIYFKEKFQWGKNETLLNTQYRLQKGERVYSKKSKVTQVPLK